MHFCPKRLKMVKIPKNNSSNIASCQIFPKTVPHIGLRMTQYNIFGLQTKKDIVLYGVHDLWRIFGFLNFFQEIFEKASAESMKIMLFIYLGLYAYNIRMYI